MYNIRFPMGLAHFKRKTTNAITAWFYFQIDELRGVYMCVRARKKMWGKGGTQKSKQENERQMIMMLNVPKRFKGKIILLLKSMFAKSTFFQSNFLT